MNITASGHRITERPRSRWALLVALALVVGALAAVPTLAPAAHAAPASGGPPACPPSSDPGGFNANTNDNCLKAGSAGFAGVTITPLKDGSGDVDVSASLVPPAPICSHTAGGLLYNASYPCTAGGGADLDVASAGVRVYVPGASQATQLGLAPLGASPSSSSFLESQGHNFSFTVHLSYQALETPGTAFIITSAVTELEGPPSYTRIIRGAEFVVPQPSAPVAGINYHPSGVTAGEFVFDGAPSVATADGASIQAYHWDFGDGTTDGSIAPTTTVTHTFATEGDHTVTLFVYDDNSQRSALVSTTLVPHLRVDQVTPNTLTPLTPGAAFTTAVTIQNDGSSTVSQVTPSASIDRAGVARITGTPTPASADIPPGLSQTFSFPSTAGTDGQATITSAATGTSADGPVAANPFTSALVVGNPGILVDLTGEHPQTGDDFNVKVTLTNPGKDPITNLSFAAPTGVADETVLPAGATPPAPAVARLVTGPDPAPPTQLDPGQPLALTYLFHADYDGSAVFTTKVSGTSKAADGSDKTVTGTNAVSVTATNPIVNAGSVSQAAMLAFDQADQIITSGNGNVSNLVANGVAVDLGLPAPTEAQIEAARQIGLPAVLGALTTGPASDLDNFAHGFHSKIVASAGADATSFGSTATSVFDKARDPATYQAMAVSALHYFQQLPQQQLQSMVDLAHNEGYLVRAALDSLTPSSAGQGLADTVAAGEQMNATVQSGMQDIADQVTNQVMAERSKAKTDRAGFLQDMGGIAGGGTYGLGKLGVVTAITGGAGKVAGAALRSAGGRLALASMENAVVATDATVAADATAAAGDTAVIGADATATGLADLDGAVSKFQQRQVGASISIADAASEGGILPSDSTKLNQIIGNVKQKYGVDLEIGVRTSEPLSVGLDVSPKPELIKPKAVSVLDKILGAPSEAGGTATVYKPIPISADQVAAYEAQSPGFAQAYEARLKAQTDLFNEYQDANSSLRVLIDGSSKYPDGVTAIAGRPTTLGSFTVPSNLKYLEQLDDPAFRSANGLSDSYASGLKSQLQTSYPDLTKVKIQAVDRGDGATSFFDGLKNRPYGSDLDVQFVRPANGAPWPAGLRGQIETDVNSQFKGLSRFPSHGWSDAGVDLSTQYFAAGAKFIMSESDPALATSTAKSLLARYKLASTILERQAALLEAQAAAATDPTARLLLQKQAAGYRAQAGKFAGTTLQDILDYGSGSKVLRFTAGDIRVGYNNPTVTTMAFHRQMSHALAEPAPSQTFTVTDMTDAPAPADGACEIGTAGCTLREALFEAAQTLQAVTITLPAGTYTLTSGALRVAGNVAVVGSGAGTTIIDAANNSGVLAATGGSLALRGVTVTRGKLVDPGDGSGVGEGAGLVADGTALTITDSTLSANHSGGDGGAIWLSGGSLTATASTFTGNFAGVDGGAIDTANAPIALSTDTFSGNGAAENGGGATIRNAPALTVDSSTFSADTAMIHGGALDLVGTGNTPTGAAGPFTLTNDTFTGNLAGQEGGALATRALVSPQGQQSTLSMSGDVLDSNQAPSGGGVAGDDTPLSISGTTFTTNTASEDDGGAIISSGPLTVNGGTYQGNTAAGNGGAIAAGGDATLAGTHFTADAAGALGGGLALLGPDTATLDALAFSADTATDGGNDVWRDGGDLTLTATTASVLQTLDGQTLSDGGSTPGSPGGSTPAQPPASGSPGGSTPGSPGGSTSGQPPVSGSGGSQGAGPSSTFPPGAVAPNAAPATPAPAERKRSGEGGLAFTGVDMIALAATGFGLLGLGVAITTTVRRRRLDIPR